LAQSSIDKRSIERVKEVKWLKLIFRGGELLAFQFGDWMINEYLAEGYLVLRGVVPPSVVDIVAVNTVTRADWLVQLLLHFLTQSWYFLGLFPLWTWLIFTCQARSISRIILVKI